ncbi:unnamed protein product [Heligmosomoides polygyrus]|uniref:Uncharacterized protein n=1 Tax=Heligmosomoides polygyrus TaxID=6339 RepID=A0A183FPJ5_HELPZ|nr:unnamed protein product [Heligmosomoides polygyrus]
MSPTSPMSRQGSGFTRRVNDAEHVRLEKTCHRHRASDALDTKEMYTNVAKGLPDSDDVPPMSRKARSGREHMSPTLFNSPPGFGRDVTDVARGFRMQTTCYQ